MVSLIYILSTRVDLCFAVHKLTKFSSNYGRVHFEVLVHLIINIRENRYFGLRYYAKIKDTTLSGLLRQDIINPENQFMVFSNSRWQGCPYTGISTAAYISFIKVDQLIIAHMLQVQLLNKVHKVRTIQHAL